MTDLPDGRIVALAAAAAIVALGALGFVPGVTTEYGRLAFAGHRSRAIEFGLFRVSVLQNLLLLAAGFAGLVLARKDSNAGPILTAGGIAFLGLWLLGVVKAGGWVPLNVADNWLHLGVGAGLLCLARGTSRRPEPVRR
jgi:hypothetical protein